MFKNMTVKTELIIAMGVVVLVLFGVGGLGVYGLNQNNESFKNVYEDRAVPLGDLGLVLDRMQRVRLNTLVAGYSRDSQV